MNDLRMTSEVGKIRLRGGRHTINATRFEQNTPPVMVMMIERKHRRASTTIEMSSQKFGE